MPGRGSREDGADYGIRAYAETGHAGVGLRAKVAVVAWRPIRERRLSIYRAASQVPVCALV